MSMDACQGESCTIQRTTASPTSRARRMQAARHEAHKMREAMTAWLDAHPDASTVEIDGELLRRRRKLMIRLLQILDDGRAPRVAP